MSYRLGVIRDAKDITVRPFPSGSIGTFGGRETEIHLLKLLEGLKADDLSLHGFRKRSVKLFLTTLSLLACISNHKAFPQSTLSSWSRVSSPQV